MKLGLGNRGVRLERLVSFDAAWNADAARLPVGNAAGLPLNPSVYPGLVAAMPAHRGRYIGCRIRRGSISTRALI